MYPFSFSNQVESFDLIPHNQKSYYGKARVHVMSDGSCLLRSYATIVAKISPDGQIHRLWGGWSATTGKHIKSFCGLNKAQFASLPLED